MKTGFPLIKVCGMKDASVAVLCERLGVDYIGFIFAPGSPRRIEPAIARGIAGRLSGKSKRVGVFTGGSAAEIIRIAREAQTGIVQLHSTAFGAEDVLRIKDAGLGVWALYGGEGCAYADAVLLDGRDGRRTGGTGRLADWDLARSLSASGTKVVLAGGISARNLEDAAATGASVLDANSSLESAPGVKSAALVEEFFSASKRLFKATPAPP